MKKGGIQDALGYFRQALALAPDWHIVHINMGIAYGCLGDDSLARYHFNRAVAAERYSGFSLIYRGEYFLKVKRYGPALADFVRAIPLNRELYPIYKGAATACAGLGRGSQSLAYTAKCMAIDKKQIEFDIVPIATPFWDAPALCKEGIGYFRGLDAMMPNRWWVHRNIADLLRRQGQNDDASREAAIAARLQNAR